MSRTTAVVQEPSIPFLIRVLYFFLFGWWATGVWILAAWFLNLTIVGLPLGLWMLNRVPQVLTLRVQATAGDPRARRPGSVPHHWPAATLMAGAFDLLCAGRLAV